MSSSDASIMRILNIAGCWFGGLCNSYIIHLWKQRESLLASQHSSVYVSWGWWYDDTTTVFSCTILSSFETFPTGMRNPLMSPQVWAAEAAVCPVILWRSDTFFIVFFNLHILNNFQVQVSIQKCALTEVVHLYSPSVDSELYISFWLPWRLLLSPL